MKRIKAFVFGGVSPGFRKRLAWCGRWQVFYWLVLAANLTSAVLSDSKDRVIGALTGIVISETAILLYTVYISNKSADRNHKEWMRRLNQCHAQYVQRTDQHMAEIREIQNRGEEWKKRPESG